MVGSDIRRKVTTSASNASTRALFEVDNERMDANEDEPPFAPKQREIQRQLGRCLMRLQQIELLVKALWADHEYECFAGEFLEAQAKRVASVSDKTLGSVVKALTGSYLAPDLGCDERDEGVDNSAVDPTRISFRFKSQISMAEGDYARTVSELDTLVQMRNELVHHFIQRFDLWSDAGCDAALAYLEECNQQVETQRLRMLGWAKAHQEAKEVHAAFLQSEEGRRFITYGIFPDGTVDWASTPIVYVLCQAEVNLAKDGWTSLNEAVRWMASKYPDKKPEQYGCARWRHLLHESRLFEIRRMPSKGSGGAEAFFRSRVAQG